MLGIVIDIVHGIQRKYRDEKENWKCSFWLAAGETGA